MEEIRKMNELTAEEIVPGQKLLLLKKITAPVFASAVVFILICITLVLMDIILIMDGQ